MNTTTPKTSPTGLDRRQPQRNLEPTAPNRTIGLPFLDPWIEAGHDLLVLGGRPDLTEEPLTPDADNAYFNIILGS